MISFLTQIGQSASRWRLSDERCTADALGASPVRLYGNVRIEGAIAESLAKHDAEDTAAWYGRGEKPAPVFTYEAAWEIAVERTKPAISGLYAVQGDGRYAHTVF